MIGAELAYDQGPENRLAQTIEVSVGINLQNVEKITEETVSASRPDLVPQLLEVLDQWKPNDSQAFEDAIWNLFSENERWGVLRESGFSLSEAARVLGL